MKKITRIVVVGLIAAFITAFIAFSGVRSYKTNNAVQNVDKCFFIKESSTMFMIVGYHLGRYDIDGIYQIEGIVMFFPFNTSIKQSQLENEILPLAKQFDCKTGEYIDVKQEE